MALHHATDPKQTSSSIRSDIPPAATHERHGRQHRMPSEVTVEVGLFDRFAGHASRFASRAPFFAACVLIVIVWAPTYFVLGNIDTWQLIINTLTTIITFLMVALLQNSQYRTDEATQHKLNAIADGLADLMEHMARSGDEELGNDVRELKRAVGIEDCESSD